ncbi:MAG: glycerophosphoryl diester phosphodiesterase membrane domain-containing protein [Atopobiaceae bacterium]|nr:glycerophosphoryl diester phosphodiesterase membrane domain-containing protein [Atopobiaceae bacterium]
MASNKSGEGRHFKEEERKQVRFSRLAFQSLPELWNFQVAAAIISAIPLSLMGWIFKYIASTADATLTSANAGSFLLSWRGPLVIVLGAWALLIVVVTELFSQILLCDDILNGRKAQVFGTIRRGFESLRRFFNPIGILMLAYVLLAAPLCGVGFSVSTTGSLYVPHFVSEVIFANVWTATAYRAVLVVLAIVGILNIFAIHGVLVDEMAPLEACKQSMSLIKKNGLRFAKTMLGVFAAWSLMLLLFIVLADVIPSFHFDNQWENVKGVTLGSLSLDEALELEGGQLELFQYRIASVFSVLFGGYLVSFSALLSSSYIMLRFTRCYWEYTRDVRELWPARDKHHKYLLKIANMVVVAFVFVIASFTCAAFFDKLFIMDPPGIVAHRTGGVLAPENSLEGLEVAIEHGCLGSETDIHRTKDGHYIINHDDTFRRLAGVDRAPKDMTLEEVRSIALKDTTGSGEFLQVPTLEEMLDITVGKEILFIELKGATADKQMVDDVVALCRERNCVDDVALISLDYEVIKYAEETYPEFETGVLIFVGFGDITNMKCDYVLMEEESATRNRIVDLHNAGKKAGVWTVNTKDGLTKFLDTGIDVVITDEISLAEEVRGELDSRSDYMRVRDALGGMFDV